MRSPARLAGLGAVVAIAAGGGSLPVVLAHAEQAETRPAPPSAQPLLAPYAVHRAGPVAGIEDFGLVRDSHSRLHRKPPAPATIQRDAPVLPRGFTTSAHDIPRRAVAAYVAAARSLRRTDAACGVRWQLLAGIGFIESGHAHSGGSDAPHWNGVASPAIYGPLLDGHDWMAWPDSDGGRLDGNTTWDRAVGPMQFMPSTWATWGADGNADHRRDPQDIDDAALAAARYLCAVTSGLNTPAGMHRAVYGYNHSWAYVRAVLTVAADYEGVSPSALGVHPPKRKPHHRHKHPQRHRHRHAQPVPSTSATPIHQRQPSPHRPSTSPTPTTTGSPTTPPSASPSPSPSPSASTAPTGTASAAAPSDTPSPSVGQ